MAKSAAARKVQSTLRELALGYPGAKEEFPWGERVVKVNKKVFVFLGRDEGDDFGLSVKLPHSKEMALLLPFASPTGYGLGKAGWVTASFGPKDAPPLEMLRQWLDESYRAVAPKKLIAALDGGPAKAVKAKPKATKKRR
jgi:predicted DNA-binding protein (MmcQ/YjbR family)